MSNKKSFSDIIPTIDEDQEIENFSEDSDEDVEVCSHLNLNKVLSIFKFDII